jgi:dTMP kinase
MNHVWKKFIVLEGIDGAGTTTQLKRLEQKFNSRGLPVYPTFEPTDGPIGKHIRRILRKEIPTTPGALARLFSADREEHIYLPVTGIQEYLNDDYWVVCDRYFFSSLVYQSMEIAFETVQELNKSFPLPEYLFYLEVSSDIAARRRAGRIQEELFEETSIQKRIIKSYERALGLFVDSPMQIHKINGEFPAEQVTEEIWKILDLG